ncbi:MAG: START domain-containing protein [Bacteroidota bacterium]
MIRQFLLFSILLSFGFLPHTATKGIEWEFKKEKSGIKVYTREGVDSNIKELKITFSVEAKLNNIIALINDVEAFQNWVYRCSMSKNLKKITHFETYDYYRIDFPWPLSDRDMVGHTKLWQDPETKVVTTTTVAKTEAADEVKNFVRISDHINKWVFTPTSPNTVDILYTLRSDPGGRIPSWMINMAIDQGPVQTMLRFRDMLKGGTYKDVQVDGIENF